MLETERSSDEALREPTYRRLYLGALEIDNPERQLKACYIILLAGRMGLRTGEIQHVRVEWIDWDRGEIAIPQHDPCTCEDCWFRANQKAGGEDEDIREEMAELLENRVSDSSDRDMEEVVDDILGDDEELPDEIAEETETPEDDDEEDERTAEEIMYEERWSPKYPRSARRVPFGHSRRLTAVIAEFMQKHDHLGITQVSMMNLVEEAAEHADGVDPENITIRGLRATASTHYATYIRNPKALQDLMGWTRIETAAQYLRRAGAFTTDVVYHAFDQGDLAPAMFPDEPKERYPILNNPLPYQKEPYDPMVYDKQTRHEIGRNMADESFRRLIHPRVKNIPDQLEYDGSRHQILTHEDYEDDVIERDGVAMFEAPTITEFYEDHDRITPADVESDDSKRRYESEQEWERHNILQSDLTEVTDDEADDYRTHIRGLLAPILVKYLEFVEWAGEIGSKYLPTPTPPKTTVGRVAVAGVGYIVIALLMMISLVQVGILNLQTMTLELRLSVLLPLCIALYIAYKLPKTDSLSEIFR